MATRPPGGSRAEATQVDDDKLRMFMLSAPALKPEVFLQFLLLGAEIFRNIYSPSSRPISYFIMIFISHETDDCEYALFYKSSV